jgi:hypothetical protein
LRTINLCVATAENIWMGRVPYASVYRQCYRLLLLLVMLIPTISGCGSTADVTIGTEQLSQIRRIAVLDFLDAPGADAANSGRIVASIISKDALLVPSWRLFERQQIRHVISEQKLQNTPLVDHKTAAQIGKVIGAEGVIVGEVGQYRIGSIPFLFFFVFDQDVYKVDYSFRLVDVETAEVLVAAKASATSTVSFERAISKGAKVIFKELCDNLREGSAPPPSNHLATATALWSQKSSHTVSLSFTVHNPSASDIEDVVLTTRSQILWLNNRRTTLGRVRAGEMRSGEMAVELPAHVEPGSYAVELVFSATRGNAPQMLSTRVEVKGVRRPADESSIALVIGVEKYDFIGDAPGCRNDAMAISGAIRKARNIAPANVIVMTDDAANAINIPNQKTIQNRLEGVMKDVGKDGLAFVYFAGHGVSQDGDLFLIPKNGGERDGIALSYVIEQMEKSAAKEKVLVLDVCRPSKDRAVVVIGPDLLKPRRTMTIFLSAAPREISHLKDDDSGGVYTDVFVRVLESAMDDPKEPVTARRLHEMISSQMRSWRLKTGKAQTPQLITDNNHDMILIPSLEPKESK